MDALTAYKKIEPSLPGSPGVYEFSDIDHKILYVGKAKNLRKRVASYFTKNKYENNKTKLLISKTRNIDFTVVATEQDAFLLENTLIKKYQPRYNIQLKDDKTYPYICIKNERFPRIFLTRTLVHDRSEYLGPYTSVRQVRSILSFLISLFPLRNCNYLLSEKNITAKKYKICLEYQIGNCLGPCEGHQNESTYNDSIFQIRNILKGNIAPVIAHLKKKLQDHVGSLEFEQANEIKEKISDLTNYHGKSLVVNPKINNVDVFSILNEEKRAFINYLKISNGSVIKVFTLQIAKKMDESKEDILGFGINELRNKFKSTAKEVIAPFLIDYPDKSITIKVPIKGDKEKLLQLSKRNVFHFRNLKTPSFTKEKSDSYTRILEKLQNDFRLPVLPTHIECFDNSNFQGASPVASVVVFKNGKPFKRDYRHFNIKTVVGIDDFASMAEIVYRRYKRLLEENKTLPQLIVIDGGKGQLNGAIKSLKLLGISNKTTVSGIAKKLEEIYLPNDQLPLHLDKKSESLRLIQRIRNEAHRFAISFHQLKSKKDLLKTDLTSIEGIGSKTAERLLTQFGSIKKIKDAEEQEIAACIGMNKAKSVISYLRQG